MRDSHKQQQHQKRSRVNLHTHTRIRKQANARATSTTRNNVPTKERAHSRDTHSYTTTPTQGTRGNKARPQYTHTHTSVMIFFMFHSVAICETEEGRRFFFRGKADILVPAPMVAGVRGRSPAAEKKKLMAKKGDILVNACIFASTAAIGGWSRCRHVQQRPLITSATTKVSRTPRRAPLSPAPGTEWCG